MSTPKFTLILDSSQIATFLECPQLWDYQYQQRLQTSTVQQDKSAMNAGTYGHKLLDIYYKAKVRGLTLNSCIDLAFSYDPDKDECECGCSLDYHKKLSPDVDILECQKCKKCLNNFRPKKFELNQETRFAVRNRFRDYCFQYQDPNDFKPLSENHVEVGFSEPVYEDAGNLFVLEGRIDLLATLQGLNVLVDHKFQMSRHYLYPKSIQFKNYAMIGKVNTLIINYIRLSKSVDKTTLQRVPVPFTLPEHTAWKQKLIAIFFNIKKIVQSNQYEQRWNACKGYGKSYSLEYPAFCPYNVLCEETSDFMKNAKKVQLFKVNENPWRPW